MEEQIIYFANDSEPVKNGSKMIWWERKWEKVPSSKGSPKTLPEIDYDVGHV